MDGYQDHNGFSIPPLMNPPPQIFGALDENGSPIQPDFLGGPYFTEDHSDLGLEDSNDAKRRRIARACDMCRKKKIKCDGKMPACTHCINYKTECIFTQVEKKRNPPKGAKYIEGLENRLGRMESLLKLSGLLNEEDGDRTDLGTLEKRLANRSLSQTGSLTPVASPAGSGRGSQLPLPNGSTHSTPQRERLPTPGSSMASPAPPARSEEEVEALSDMMCSLVTNHCGETKYIGSSSGFSIFSPKGIQWVNEKTGDDSFREMIASSAVEDSKWMHWKPEIFADIFKQRTFVPLPHQQDALSLLKDYFENFNCMFPLFHEPTFMHLVRRQYSEDPPKGSGWFASLNVALAIAHRIRVMSNLVPQEDDRKAWGFLKNALGVLTELTMRNTDLLSVQAILGMALFLMGTPNPQPSFSLVASAVRLAHSIGLHKRGSGFNLSPEDIEQRRRVFWIAYLLDKDICLRSGRPPAQDDDDMSVELPNENPVDNVGNIPLADNKGKVNIFRLMCGFAIIQSKVYKQLYSTKASKQTDGELLNTIGELDHELEEWKDAIPLDFRPEHEIKASHTPLMLNIVVMHFGYYNCLMTIHRMSVHHGYWTSRLSNYAIQGLNARPLNPRVFSSAALCVQAARASIHLIKYIPPGDYACVWLIIYYPVSSLVTLFANVLQNPQDMRARSDAKLINQVVAFLSMLNPDEENGGVKRMLAVCSEFERVVKVVLEKADKESQSKRKRKNKDKGKSEITPNLASQRLPEKRALPRSPVPKPRPSPANIFTPGYTGSLSQSFSPSLNGFSPGFPKGDAQLYPDYSPGLGDFRDLPNSPSGISQTIPNNILNYTNDISTPLNMGSFQQPFVPQDLWQMPMTLEWDWQDMTSMNFPINPGDLDPQQQPYMNGTHET